MSLCGRQNYQQQNFRHNDEKAQKTHVHDWWHIHCEVVVCLNRLRWTQIWIIVLPTDGYLRYQCCIRSHHHLRINNVSPRHYVYSLWVMLPYPRSAFDTDRQVIQQAFSWKDLMQTSKHWRLQQCRVDFIFLIHCRKWKHIDRSKEFIRFKKKLIVKF